jgi:hypothetical protein
MKWSWISMLVTLLKMGNKISSVSRLEKHICYFVKKGNLTI